MTLVGLISDTHGLLRSEVKTALAGVDRILHAGDVGRPEILNELATLAPVTAIRGNVDYGDWAEALPADEMVRVEGRTIYMVHSFNDIRIDLPAANIDAVILGHTHKPLIEHRGGILYINPGSAGPRRFSLPVSIGFLQLTPHAPIEAWLQTFEH